jgi:hypothetical protein
MHATRGPCPIRMRKQIAARLAHGHTACVRCSSSPEGLSGSQESTPSRIRARARMEGKQAPLDVWTCLLQQGNPARYQANKTSAACGMKGSGCGRTVGTMRAGRARAQRRYMATRAAHMKANGVGRGKCGAVKKKTRRRSVRAKRVILVVSVTLLSADSAIFASY